MLYISVNNWLEICFDSQFWSPESEIRAVTVWNYFRRRQKMAYHEFIFFLLDFLFLNKENGCGVTVDIALRPKGNRAPEQGRIILSGSRRFTSASPIEATSIRDRSLKGNGLRPQSGSRCSSALSKAFSICPCLPRDGCVNSGVSDMNTISDASCIDDLRQMLGDYFSEPLDDLPRNHLL